MLSFYIEGEVVDFTKNLHNKVHITYLAYATPSYLDSTPKSGFTNSELLVVVHCYMHSETFLRQTFLSSIQIVPEYLVHA